MPNCSPPPPPPPFSSWFLGLKARSSSLFVVLIVLVPLLLVSLVVFSVDSPASWFSFHSSSSFNLRGDGFADNQSKVEVGEVSLNSTVYNYSSASLPLVVALNSAPAPAPEPASIYAEGMKSEKKVSPPPPPPPPPPPRKMINDIKLERLELGLARARATIREALQNQNQTSTFVDKDYTPQGPVYRNAYAFHRSYLEMEKLFRVYVYEEGEPPLFHDGPCRSIYSMEGRFIHNMEMENLMRTRDPDHAHVHFLPFSIVKMVKFIYQPRTFNTTSIKRTIIDYINTISTKYPYWNRSLGADHFMLSCHDWGPDSSHAMSHLYMNSIRVLCNANISEGFKPLKDVSLPEINLKTGLNTGIIGGPSASGRPTLAFFAGGMHGPIRPVLLQHWKDKDQDMQVFEYLPKGVDYYDKMRRSKYCICPSGYEVASPRVVEAIYLQCVPVIISDHYVLPFSDVLNWKAFSVQVSVEDIPNLKKILMGIPWRQYIRMQRRLKIVQRHFIVNTPPERFDVYHMILHSVWLRRLNVRIRHED